MHMVSVPPPRLDVAPGGRQRDRRWPPAAARSLLALALWVLAPGLLWAAIQGAVRGTVVDGRTNAPAAGATVRLVGLGSTFTRTTTTNVQGQYIFPDLDVGEYALTVEAPGLAAGPVIVAVRSGDTLVQDLALSAVPESEGPPLILPPMTVTAPAPGTPASSASQVVVSQQTLERTPGAMLNIKEALKNTVPGAVEASEHLHFHGAHEVGYFVNGVPIPDNSVFGQFSSLIDPRIVKSLEVISGGFPAEYGDRTSGIVNIVTKSGADLPNHLEVAPTVGTSGIRGLTLQGGGGDKPFSGVFLANIAHTDRYINSPTFQDIHDRGNSLLLFANGSLHLAPQDTLRFLSLASGANIQIPNTPAEQDAGVDNRERERNNFQTLVWDHAFGDALGLSTSLYHHGIKVRLLENANNTPFFTNERRDVDYYGGKGDLTFRGLPGHILKAGVNAYLVWVSEQFSVVANPPDPTFPPFTFGPTTSRGHEVSAYLQDQWVPLEGLTVNAGLRYDLFVGQVPEGMPSPRVGATYRIAPTDTRLFASVDRLFNPPPLEGIKIANSPFAGQFGQVPVLAERDTYVQGGVEQRSPWGSLRVTGWLRREKHFLDHEEIDDSTVFVPVNVAYGKSLGMDVEFQTGTWRGWSARGFYALSYSRGRGIVSGGVFPTTPEPAGASFFLDHDQRHTLVGNIRYEDKERDWWGTVAVKYGSGFTDGNGPEHLPQNVTVDLAGEKALQLTSWMRGALRVELLNVFNSRFFIATQSEFVGTHTNIPRTFLITVRGEF